MADPFASLKERAREAAQKLGHALGSFHVTPGHHGTAFANCEALACGLGVVIDLAPRRADLAVAGDAVTLLCQKLVNEQRAALVPPVPPRTMPPAVDFEVLDISGECLFCHKTGATGGFCGPTCRHEYRIRTSAAYARDQVLHRDRGVCAKCGLDADLVERTLLEWSLTDLPGYAGLVAELEDRDFPRHRIDARSLWDANHIVPVCEGGGSCGLDNLETLCLPCHARETAALMARLDERKRKTEEEMRAWLARQTAERAPF